MGNHPAGRRASESVRAGARVLSAKWRAELLDALGAEPVGFSELGRRVGASRKSLWLALREMEGEGLVEREPVPSDRRRINYRLTTAGLALDASMNELAHWHDRFGRRG